MDAADQLRASRLRIGVTQSELEARSGVTQSNIAAYESGSRTPSAKMLNRLMAAMAVRPSALLAENRAVVLGIFEAHKGRNVAVFGSVARGEDTPDSDVDFLADFDDDASIFDEVEVFAALEKIFGQGKVDIVERGALKPRHRSIIRDEVLL